MTEQPAVDVKPSNWNIPNALTTLRIVLVPVYGWALLSHGGHDIGWRVAAYLVFLVAMITDKVDGDLARKHNLITDFGKIADPIADKAITGMAFIGVSIIMDTWWMWAVTAVVLVREWSVTLLRLSIMKSVVIAAARSGKIKTLTQALALGGLTLPCLEATGAWDIPGKVIYVLSLALLAVAVVLTITSGYEFFRDAARQRNLEPEKNLNS
ncbi:MAG TPA: CDP-diacylglycerol--glycerol-3-phosphate 3-phosphatidyltransferase [Nocardioides sp.]|nr:CDP-diacylglycerol--glycerol-3-phosphate 3-phosphatidyltransferase [Nocardioides sp.]